MAVSEVQTDLLLQACKMNQGIRNGVCESVSLAGNHTTAFRKAARKAEGVVTNKGTNFYRRDVLRIFTSNTARFTEFLLKMYVPKDSRNNTLTIDLNIRVYLACSGDKC